MQPLTSDVAGSSRPTDFASPASLLARAFPPELGISKQRLRQLEHIELIRSKRTEGRQRLCFSARPFVLCGLPTRKLPPGQLLYTRRNGQFVLQVTGHPEFGLPFGQDRIVPIFLATLAVQQRSQTIRFRSAAQMMKTFGMQNGGKEYRRLVAAFRRIFGATIFFGTDSTRGSSKVVQRSRFSFLQETQIWWNRDPNQRLVEEAFENVIVLSDEFYREVTKHPIPTDLEAVKALSGAPAVLDLYMWLAYRCFKGKRVRVDPDLRPLRLGGPDWVHSVHARATLRSNAEMLADDNARDVAGVPGRDEFRSQVLADFERAQHSSARRERHSAERLSYQN